jgi:hypothetical protein
LAAGVAFAAFGPPIPGVLDAWQPYRVLLGFLIIGPLIWSMLRGSRRNAATTALIFCAIATWGLATWGLGIWGLGTGGVTSGNTAPAGAVLDYRLSKPKRGCCARRSN